MKAARVSIIHIPACSPDYNSTEECISKIKEALRGAKAQTVRKLFRSLAQAIEKIPIDDICGWFAHCGYTFSLN
jgi:hypothetical protein